MDITGESQFKKEGGKVVILSSSFWEWVYVMQFSKADVINIYFQLPQTTWWVPRSFCAWRDDIWDYTGMKLMLACFLRGGETEGLLHTSSNCCKNAAHKTFISCDFRLITKSLDYYFPFTIYILCHSFNSTGFVEKFEY